VIRTSTASAAARLIDIIDNFRMVPVTRKLGASLSVGFEAACVPRIFPHYYSSCHTAVVGHFITMVSTFSRLPGRTPMRRNAD
jgi:hypothetical protein